MSDDIKPDRPKPETPSDWMNYTPTAEETAEAQKLIDQGYKQTSARYRSLCRIPEGMTPLEALRSVDEEAAKDLEERLQDWAESHYMRIYSRNKRPQDHIEVSVGVFRAFKRLGGPVSR
jgi:hypothetical protein